MLLKISLSSMRKMKKDYIVLFMGLVIAISVFYMFQTLAQNKAFIEGNGVIKSIGFVFQVGTVLLSFVTFFYVIYANSFLLSLRQKEFGMYMMLGAKKNKVAQLLFLETLGVGFGSLLTGILIGALFSKWVAVFLMKQLDFSAAGYQSFYFPSIMITVIFFVILFFITAIINAFKLARKTVLDLIKGEEQKDPANTLGIFGVIIAIIGILSLVTGYYTMPRIEYLAQLGLIIAASTTTIGTYLIFISLLPVFVNRLKKNRKLKERGLNSFTLAQLDFRVNSLTKILATVTILIALGVGAMAVGTSFHKNAQIFVDSTYAYDVSIHDPVNEDRLALDKMVILEQNQYRYKVNDEGIYYLKNDLVEKPPLIMENTTTDSFVREAIRISKPLPDPIYRTDLNDPLIEILPGQWWQALRTELNSGYQMFGGKSIFVVDKDIYEGLKGEEHQVLIAQVDDFLKYKSELKAITARQGAKASIGEGISNKYSDYVEMYAFSSGTMFMGFFLGIAFLAMMASCLMFKILSGATKDISRYEILRKIGVRKEFLSKSIYREMFALFIFPGIVGLAHCLWGMKMFSFILVDVYAAIWLPVGIFVLVYAIYYFITVQLYKGIVLPQ